MSLPEKTFYTPDRTIEIVRGGFAPVPHLVEANELPKNAYIVKRDVKPGEQDMFADGIIDDLLGPYKTHGEIVNSRGVTLFDAVDGARVRRIYPNDSNEALEERYREHFKHPDVPNTRHCRADGFIMLGEEDPEKEGMRFVVAILGQRSRRYITKEGRRILGGLGTQPLQNRRKPLLPHVTLFKTMDHETALELTAELKSKGPEGGELDLFRPRPAKVNNRVPLGTICKVS